MGPRGRGEPGLGESGDLAVVVFVLLALQSPAAASLAGRGIRDAPAPLACGPEHVQLVPGRAVCISEDL